MTWAHYSTEVTASPSKVWSEISDPRNLAKWDDRVKAVDGVPDDGLHEGITYTTTLKLVGVIAKVKAKVVTLDPPRESVVHLQGLILGKVETTIAPLKGDRSRLTQSVTFRFRGGLIGHMAARALRLTGGPDIVLKRAVENQKRRIEEG
jgi:hypothetical protein